MFLIVKNIKGKSPFVSLSEKFPQKRFDFSFFSMCNRLHKGAYLFFIRSLANGCPKQFDNFYKKFFLYF